MSTINNLRVRAWVYGGTIHGLCGQVILHFIPNVCISALNEHCVCVCVLGYWISHRAIKTVYDHDDGFAVSAHDITAVKNCIYTMFNVRM